MIREYYDRFWSSELERHRVSSAAVEAAQAVGLNPQFIDDAAELPSADGSFDVVVIAGSAAVR